MAHRIAAHHSGASCSASSSSSSLTTGPGKAPLPFLPRARPQPPRTNATRAASVTSTARIYPRRRFLAAAAAAQAAPATTTTTTTATAAAAASSSGGLAPGSATLVLPNDTPAPTDFPRCLPPRDTLPPLPPLDDDYERRTSFAPFANWLVPGALVLGRYPFVEPSRCLGRTQGEAQLAALMAPPAPPSPWVSSASSGSGSSSSDGDDEAAAAINAANEYDGSVPSSSLVNNGNPGAGVRTFFSLQAELPPQSAMPVGGAGGGFLPYKAAAELIHAALSPPPPQECVDGLRNPTLDKFLPPRKRATSQAYDAFRKRESALSFVHCPVEDLGVPSMGQLKKAVAELAERLAKAEAARRRQQAASGGGGADAPAAAASPSTEADAAGSILLHCWGGRGRAGLVGACLLVAAYGLSAEEALLRVQRAFDTRRDNGRLSPETDEQRELVRAFEREVR